MAGYINSTGSSIGSLLRSIQEQKSGSPVTAPNAQTGSPIRDVVQNPLQGSEGIGSSKMVSLRPEGVLTATGSPIEQGTPQSSRIGPISIGGEAGVGPGAPGPFSPETKSLSPNLSAPSSSGASASIRQPSLGTTIKPVVPTTTAGQSVGQVNLVKDINNADITAQKTREAIAAGDRSTAETDARLAALEEQNRMANEAYAAKDAELSGKTFNPSSPEQVSIARNLGQVLGAQATGLPPQSKKSPTKTTSPGLTYSKPSAPLSVATPTPVNISPTTKGLTIQSPSKAPTQAPSLGTTIGNALANLRKMFGF